MWLQYTEAGYRIGMPYPLADLGGMCRAHATPYGTQFFHFCIHFHQKAPALEVHTPLMGAHPLVWEILDPPLLSIPQLQILWHVATIHLVRVQNHLKL